MNSETDCAILTRPPIDLIVGASIFLDFDGTLVELSETPDAVTVSEDLRTLLVDLHARLDGRLAIISGRAADDVRSLIEPAQVLVGGSHGLEIAGMDPPTADRAGIVEAIAAELRSLERDFPGVLVEEKRHGVALHFRMAPDAADACRDAVLAAAQRSGLEVQPGKMVFELRIPGANKGDALRLLMSQPPFAGTRPIFFGDDLTDEAAFCAVRELGGAGILVDEMRETAATFRLDGARDVLDWLCAAAELLE